MVRCVALTLTLLASMLGATSFSIAGEATGEIDFNRDIRPILSNACLMCHGPDENERQAGLRLDVRESALGEADSGSRAIVPGDLEQSELIRRVLSEEDYERMPPTESGKPLTSAEVELLKKWVQQGAAYAEHWSYVKPQRPALPSLSDAHAELTAWPKNEIDHFVLGRLVEEGVQPSPEADRYALVRRVSLDLTGLPPTVEEVDEFVNDAEPRAYERMVDRLLAKPAYGEHWARQWLDLARYADSAGYADDPPRTIWAYRDWVIDALNRNLPFDQFTIEQIAGDMLPNPLDSQLVATAFNRNTMTNNEGGTDDEEFRNVAIVDRVNTTLAVWMGTTIACCQCHDHKYDPISQQEYFQLFAIFNNTQDNDQRAETPLLDVWSDEQRHRREKFKQQIAELKQSIAAPPAEVASEQQHWEEHYFDEPAWQAMRPAVVSTDSGTRGAVAEDNTIVVAETAENDIYRIEFPIGIESDDPVTALQIEAVRENVASGEEPETDKGGFVITRVLGTLIPPSGETTQARYVRIENTGKQKILSLAEVQIFDGPRNIASEGTASQSSTGFGGEAARAIDGNTDGEYTANSTTHTNTEDNPWWELDLQAVVPIERIVIWNRTDNALHTRLKDFTITLLDADREEVWSTVIAEPPNPSEQYTVSGVRELEFAKVYASRSEPGLEAVNVLDEKFPNATGWGASTEGSENASLTLIPRTPISGPPGSVLKLTIEQLSPRKDHTLDRFRVVATNDASIRRHFETPERIVSLLKKAPEMRVDQDRAEIREFYLTVSPRLNAMRQEVEEIEKKLASLKPTTTVPVMREMAADQRRTTRIQRRGNFLDQGDVVEEGVPAAFHSLPEGSTVDRLALAEWLIDEDNPLTARVIANRYWESIFGRGIVLTSEEFGSQGELPSHPALLDWLATELQRLDWDVKEFLKTIVMSATYRQSSQVTEESYARDPENVLLARGPRFRLPAETIRDQALAVSGLLSPKMGGPSVNPPQPKMGVNAAFGGGIDWETSEGEDRYRRGLYTTWRRSNPYPSMATFDAPNREVCTIRRATTNTPLQALVTLNDPVYVEAAQSLARRMMNAGSTVEDRAFQGFRICLARPPSDVELEQLVQLYEQAYAEFAVDQEQAQEFIANPLNAPPEDVDAVELAAWTVVGNVMLNLDEMFMKR